MSATVETLRPAQDEAAWDLFVFRKARERLRSEDLKQQLLSSLRPARSGQHQDRLLNCLVRAGELECALADLDSPEFSRAAEAVDALAAQALQADPRPPANALLQAFERLQLPHTVSVSHAEGFSYYGLHPLDFWDLCQRVRLETDSAAIVGIRSIGSTLSSIVRCALQGRGVEAQRMTVRPAGPPYQRRLQFTSGQMDWVREHLGRGSEFIVVDEGPGFSGSSFTAVGRALRQAGVPNRRILFLGSRSPESSELQSRFDPEWNSFRSCSVVQGTRIPYGAKTYCAGGYWRQSRIPDQQEWPACWTQLERNKYLSADGRSLFKFEGFGRYGESVLQRARQLAEAGLAPPVLGYDNGFVEYVSLGGEPVRAGRCDAESLRHLAKYCALRADAQRAPAPAPVSLESMLEHNLWVEFGLEPRGLQLPLEKLVMADGRMMPHEWVACEGQLMKTDGASHGDDHLFPGPTDIAWDLAGVIAEWNLGREQESFFVGEYARRSGDQAASRLPAYLLAYSVFRMAWCRMGAAAMAAWDETHRLKREYLRHRRRVAALLGVDEDRSRRPGLPASLPAEQAA